MKDKLPCIVAAAGVLVAVVALVGRFYQANTVLGGVLPGGVAASSLLLCANTLLLIAVFMKLYNAGK